jgi:hypothetical protein
VPPDDGDAAGGAVNYGGRSHAPAASLDVALFTADEHAIIARWLGRKPVLEARGIDPEEALRRLGFSREPNQLYTPLDAAVAHIVLEGVEARLPSYAVIDFARPPGEGITVSRKYRGPADKPRRRVGIISRRLFAINWADSAPGISWPVEYRATWLPIYDRWVVTASADGDDAFGYTDFAIGCFTHETPIVEGAGEIIRRDWRAQADGWGQERWAYVLDNGIIGDAKALHWADEVWGSEEAEQEDDLE